MKRLLLITALLLAAPAAQAGQFHNFGVTHVPAHWLLDRGPRIIQVPPGYDVGDGRPLTTRSAIDGGWDRSAEARAKAIADQRTCAPVRVSGDTTIVHPALGCR